MEHMTQRQYLERLNPNSPVPPQITVGDVLEIYAQIDAALVQKIKLIEQTQQAAEAAEILDWLPISIPARDVKIIESVDGIVRKLSEPSQLVHTVNERNPLQQDAEARADLTRSIALPGGKLRPYSSYNNTKRHRIVDDHEIHSYTVDGE